MKNKLLLAGIAALSFFFSVETNAQAPTAAFTLNQATVCAGGTIQVTDASTDSPTAWSYTLSGPAMITSTLQSPLLILSTDGDYTLTLIATNGSGDSAPTTETLTVRALPLVSATGPMSAVCAGAFITLNGSGASTYAWTNGVIDGSSFAVSSSAVYTVTGTNTEGCQNTATLPVTVNPLPVLAVSGSTAICIGDVASFTVSGADTYSWVSFGNTDNITDSPIITTTYTVSGTDALTSCTNTTTKNLVVNVLPAVSVNSGSICSGTIFTMTPGGASTYVYSNGASTVMPLSNESFTVTGTDANGCKAIAVSDVTVNTLPVISVSGGTICSGSVYTLSPSGAATYSYAPSLTATVNPTSTTSYSISGTDANGCKSITDAVAEVTVFALPALSVNSGSICAGDVFTITASNSTLLLSYSGGTNIVTPNTSTNYTVMGEDVLGCRVEVVSQVTVHALPVVSVNSGTICSGDVFTMTPSGAASYIFVNGSATVNPTSNTSYSVSGTSAEGCVSAAYAISDVTVHALPVISVTSGSVCLGTAYTMTAGGAATYVYQGGSATVTPVANTSYTVTGVSTQGCNSSNTATSTVSVWSLPVLSISGTTVVCAGETVTLTASGASTYSWNTSGPINVATYTVIPTANATYTAYGVDANGCENFITQAVAVNALPVITVNSGVICPGGTFTMIPAGASTYVFQGGSATVSPVSTSMYSVSGTDINGCTSAMPAISTVSVVNALTITVAGNTTICQGQTANLTANGATTYSWNATVLTNTIAVNPSTTTNYIVTGMSSGCSNTAAVTVSVNALPSVTVASSSPVICVGESATLTSGGALSYSWDNSPSTAAAIVVNPTINTTYIVTGTDANSCSNQATVIQNVSECTDLAKYEATSVQVSIYPNPSNGQFTLKLTQETFVSVLNGIGQVVYANKLSNGDTTITLNNQPNGIYFVQLKQGNQTKTVKVVKN